MKIAFLSSYDPCNINYWSGTLYYIFKTLKKRNEVIWVGNETIQTVYEFYQKKYGHLVPFIKERYALIFGLLLSEKFKVEKYDVIFCRDSLLGAYLKTDIPIIYLSDATYNLLDKKMLNYQDESFGRMIDELDRRMILNAGRLIFSSEWAKQNAIEYYQSPANKIDVIELGANIETNDIKENILEKSNDVCNLLFIGKYWIRKGGNKTLETFRLLKSRGFRCTLTIIGSQPPEPVNDPDLFIYPFIDKSTQDGLQLLDSILQQSHFLLLPTEFDCFGIVFCEASAHGIPSITADVGGVSQVVREGKNGYLLSESASAEEYAHVIEKLFLDQNSYNELCKLSRLEFENRLNWDVWEEKTNILLTQIASKSI